MAFALEARSTSEVASIKLSLTDRLKDKLTNLGDLAEDVLSADDADDVANVLAGSAAQDEGETPRLGRLDSLQPTGRISTTGDDEEAIDDPLWCSAAAVRAAMPRRLAALRHQDALLDLQRVWATICCCAWLQTLNVSWLWTDGDLYPEIEKTIVDAGREWVEAYAAERPSLAAALADGGVERAAQRVVVQWHRAWVRRVSELRRSKAVTSNAPLSHLHRACTEVTRALCTKVRSKGLCTFSCALTLAVPTRTQHDTFSVFLSLPLDGLQRWQGALLAIRASIELALTKRLDTSQCGPSWSRLSLTSLWSTSGCFMQKCEPLIFLSCSLHIC